MRLPGLKREIAIGSKRVGGDARAYIVAEMSANHNRDLEHARALVRAAKDAGADAVKVQTYTADTMTLASSEAPFRIAGGTAWDGRLLHDLYAEAYMPWEWQPELNALAQESGLDFFSTPFDATAVDFLEQLHVPAYKIASFELVDIPLIRFAARTGKPLIISTGMATREEIEEALQAACSAGTHEVILLKCTSAYPAPPSSANLRTISRMREWFQIPIGLSDHTPGMVVAVTAVGVGVSLIEKHLTLSRGIPGPDSAFSLEPHEFRQMVEAVRTAEQSLGTGEFGPVEKEMASRGYRRSLFAVRDIRKGERLTPGNIRSIRPAGGLHPRHYDYVIRRTAAADIPVGKPLAWTDIGD